jgi:acyl transferase domain-containing protein
MIASYMLFVTIPGLPSSVTISGDPEQVNKVLNTVKKTKPDLLARPLNVDRAYHSYHMEEIGSMYEVLTSRYVVAGGSTQYCLFFSTTSGQQLLSMDNMNSEYWKNNLENPVLFHTAVKNLVSHRRETNLGVDNPLFLEVGPHSALAGPLRQILTEISCASPYVSCLVRKKDAEESFLTAMGQLFLHNLPVDLSKLTDPESNAKVVTNLPTYPWHHGQSLLFETRLTKAWRWQKFRKHELLGVRVAETSDDQPARRNLFMCGHVPWIKDHIIKGDVIFPCAGYIAMAGEATKQLSGMEDVAGYSLRGVTVDTAMVLSISGSSLRRVSLTDRLDSEWYEFVVSSYNGASWVKHCVGQVRPRTTQSQVRRGSERMPIFPRSVEMKQWYKATATVGGQHGPLFQGIKNVTSSTTTCEANATAFHTYDDEETEYSIHPTMLDNAFQILLWLHNTG